MRTFNQILREGTWALNTDYGPEAIRRIEDLKDWLYGKFGNDQLFDNLDNAIDNIKKACSSEEAIKTKCIVCKMSNCHGKNTSLGWVCDECSSMKIQKD